MTHVSSAIPIRALKTSAAARYLGLSASWLRKQRMRGSEDPGQPGPQFIRLQGTCLYEIDELDRWLDEAKRLSAAGHQRPGSPMIATA
jgi:hypothetical protein